MSNSVNNYCLKSVQFKSLAEVCEFENSKRKTLELGLMENGDIPYYGANGVKGKVNGFTHDGDYILIARVGSKSIEEYSIRYTMGKIWANENVHVIRTKSNLNNKFLFHYLKGLNFREFF